MTVDLVIGAPAWDRAWALPIWFANVRACVDPATTGLVFVVPPTDTATREAIASLSYGFDFVEVIRDRGPQLRRDERPEGRHVTLALARNSILGVVERVRPAHYLSWDTDYFVPGHTVEYLRSKDLPLVTVWGWLNRQPPRSLRLKEGRIERSVLWQEPVRATAMAWGSDGRPWHYPAHEYGLRCHGVWQCGVALAWQLMQPRAYRMAHYAPHHDGEDIPFNWQLRQRGVQRYCCGEIQGVHLYDQDARDEIALGWPGILTLADQQPLAATWRGERSVEYAALGFFPAADPQDLERVA